MKKGKVSTKSKSQISSDLAGLSADPKLYDVDPELLKQLKAEGLAHRWINRKKYIDQHGFHKSAWKVYKTVATEKRGSLDFRYGVDPEGYICRGDLVLAVKPIAAQEAHKQKLARKTAALNGFNAQAAKQLQSIAGSKVYEGYEANDEAKEMGSEDLGEDE